jgi:hypothetical protein
LTGVAGLKNDPDGKKNGIAYFYVLLSCILHAMSKTAC